MMKQSWVLMGFAVAALAAGPGCKQSTTADTTASASATPSVTVAASPPPPKVAQPGAKADAPFEGEIQVALYEPISKTPASIAYDIKGDKVRSAPTSTPDAAGRAPVVGDLKVRKAYAIVDSSKSYATIEIDNAAARDGKTVAPAVTKTGKMEKVAGRDCEDWVITDAGERFDACVARGIAYFDPPDSGHGASSEPAWAAVLTKERVFPLRVVGTDKAGKQEFRAEAMKIEQRKLDDALFKVPNDYRSVPMSKAVKVASVP